MRALSGSSTAHCSPGSGAQRGRRSVRARASVTGRKQPGWTGDGLVSRVVNWMINTPSIYGVMKVLAKGVLVSTATSRGVGWEAHVANLRQRSSELEALKRELEDPTVTYPDYYLQPFHAYDEGNLNWLAAWEVEPATYSMALRTFKGEQLTPEAAMMKLRDSIVSTHRKYREAGGHGPPAAILDVGCSVGISTRWLRAAFPNAEVTGLDLSPYFLAVAEAEERHSRPTSRRRIRYVHALAEATGLPDASFDLVTYNFVIHEAPQAAIRAYIREAARLLKPGGTLVFVDNNPQSATIQNLPPALFVLMKSTEPHSDEYYSLDLEAAMREAGFDRVTTMDSDHRHRAVHGTRPASA